MRTQSAKSMLNQLIKRKGSKKVVAEEIGITVAYINMILAGRRPSKRLEKLIKFYLSLT